MTNAAAFLNHAQYIVQNSKDKASPARMIVQVFRVAVQVMKKCMHFLEL